LLFVGYNGCKL